MSTCIAFVYCLSKFKVGKFSQRDAQHSQAAYIHSAIEKQLKIKMIWAHRHIHSHTHTLTWQYVLWFIPWFLFFHCETCWKWVQFYPWDGIKSASLSLHNIVLQITYKISVLSFLKCLNISGIALLYSALLCSARFVFYYMHNTTFHDHFDVPS